MAGLLGGESSVDQRLPSINLTVLSGDIDHNDHDSGEMDTSHMLADIVGANSHHIVTFYGTEAVPYNYVYYLGRLCNCWWKK